MLSFIKKSVCFLGVCGVIGEGPKRAENMLRFPSMPNFRRLENAEERELQNSSESSEVIIGEGVVGHTEPINRKKKVAKLYRSSCPDFLTEEEAELFRSINFKSIIDFRSRKEYYKGRKEKLIDQYYSLYKVRVIAFIVYTTVLSLLLHHR